MRENLLGEYFAYYAVQNRARQSTAANLFASFTRTLGSERHHGIVHALFRGQTFHLWLAGKHLCLL